jgi:serine/threonine-protein kinase
VLYFENLSPDTTDAYLADALTEELINRLGRIERLVVRSRQATQRFRARTGDDPAALGRGLNVVYLVSGRVRHRGRQVHVGVELVRATTGTHLWGNNWNRSDEDLVALEADIARDVAGAIAGRLLPAERSAVTRRPDIDLQAYTLYLRGRFEFNRFSSAGIRNAVDYFTRAIAADSTYAPAYAGLADAYNWLADYEPPRRLMPQMKAAALRALELDPTSAEAHVALGNIQLWFEWDPRAAEASFQRAHTLAPRYAPAYWTDAVALVSLGRQEEAVNAATRAHDLDPLTYGWLLSEVLIMVRRYDAASQAAGRELAIDSTNAMIHFSLGTALVSQGLEAEGLAHLRRARALGGGTFMLASFAHWAARTGATGEARAALGELTRLAAQHWVMPTFFAEVYSGLGEIDSAFAWLERGLEDRPAAMLSLLWSVEWDPLRADPRFPALLRRMGLQ